MMTTLEKVKRLEKYIASDVAAIDSALDMTIEKLLKRESARIGDTQQRLMKQLEGFEDRYGIKSAEVRERIVTALVNRHKVVLPICCCNYSGRHRGTENMRGALVTHPAFATEGGRLLGTNTENVLNGLIRALRDD